MTDEEVREWRKISKGMRELSKKCEECALL